ncbi:MAG: hypothetical protein WCI18_15825 [Pseudomonadota bacterium]
MNQTMPVRRNFQFISRFGTAMFDGCLALFIGVYGILLGSLGILKGPLKLDRFMIYIAVLIPKGLLSESIRSAIEWRLGHFGDAIMKLENIIVSIETIASERGKVAREHVLLVDFYTLLTRCYLHTGRVDEAMAVVIRAKKFLKRDYLKELVGLDAKTAQLVRAGLAAGRLLDGEGLATLFVKADTSPSQSAQPRKSEPTQERQGASAKNDLDLSNVIPFRRPEWEKK